MPGGANTAGHALNFAYGRKVNGAEEECRRHGIAFLPMVAETFSGWHSGAERGGEKAGGCPLKTHCWAGGRRGYLPPVEQDGHPPSARQRRHPRQPGACPALGAHRRNYLKCNTFMKPLECTLFALSHADDQFVHYSLKYTPHTK